MNRRLTWTTCLFLASSLLLLSAARYQPVAAQEKNESAVASADKLIPKRSALGVRQESIERMMEDLERRFKKLAQSLEKTEPERAERLVKTLQQSKELLIQPRMKKVVKLLDSAQLDAAAVEQEKLLADLRLLIQMLLDETADQEKIRQEIEKLEKWKEQITSLIKEELPQRRESEKIAKKDETLKDLDAQIKAVEKLIKKQENVVKSTQSARDGGAQRLGKVADQQRNVRIETEDLAKKIAKAGKIEEDPTVGAKDENSQGGQSGQDGKQGSQGGQKGSQGGQKGSKGGQKGSQGGQKGSQGGQKGSQSGQKGSQGGQKGSQGEQKSAQNDQPQEFPQYKPVEKPIEHAEPGQKPLEQASGHQKNAESNLETGKGPAAERDEKEALVDLNRALDELKKERRRIASLPPEAFEKMAKKQDSTAEKAKRLAQEMAQAKRDSDPKAGKKGEQGAKGKQGGQGGQGGKGGKGGQQPGQQRVQQAQKSMQRASRGLREQSPEDASRNQEEAIRQLRKAMQEIEDRLKQLRQETQEERLARLEARFREMLARQQDVTKKTAQLEAKKRSRKWRRTDRLALAKQAKEERALAQMALEALTVIVEDGTSVVFPHVVNELHEDLNRVAELLDEQKTGGYTQLLQQEIETTLEELIEAIKKLQRDRKAGGGGGGGGGYEPLLPSSAELKLLRSMQLRVNRRTRRFDEFRPDGELDTVLAKEIDKITKRQAEVVGLTELVLERN